MASDSIERLVSRDTLCLFYCLCLGREICWSWQSFVGGQKFWRSTRKWDTSISVAV